MQETMPTHGYDWKKEQVAAYLHRSANWINTQLRADFPIPGVKLGGRWAFRKDEIDEWVRMKFRLGRSYADHLKKKA